MAVVSNCPQINNPCNGFNPTPVRMIVAGIFLMAATGCVSHPPTIAHPRICGSVPVKSTVIAPSPTVISGSG